MTSLADGSPAAGGQAAGGAATSELVVPAPAVRDSALSAGADAVLSKRELGEALAPLVASLRGQRDLSGSRDS